MSGVGGGHSPAHPPIYGSGVGHHGVEEEDDDAAGSDIDHIAESLVAGLLVDDHEDDEVEHHVMAQMNDLSSDLGALQVQDMSTVDDPQIGEEKKVEDDKDEPTSKEPKGKMQLVKLPAGFAVGEDGNVIAAEEARLRQEAADNADGDESEDDDADGEEETPVDDSVAIAADENENENKAATAGTVSKPEDTSATMAATKKKKKRKPKKKRHDDDWDENEGALGEDGKAPSEDLSSSKKASVTTSQAIKNVKAQVVSIGEATKVQVKRNESSASLNSDKKGSNGEDGSSHVIDFLNSKNKITGTEKNKGGKASKSKKSKGKGGATLGNDEAANLRAARQFNKSVRECVEQSDPDAMCEILHDRRNHRFALDANVLETVMKAYTMAAMFDDALYCLRNCTLPGTLSAGQCERILTCLPQNLRNSSAYTAADMIDALCIATEFDQPTSRTYFMRIVRGIALEFLEEATSARDRICSAPCERLVRSASCVVDARLRRGRKNTDLLVEPGHQLGLYKPDTSENRGIQAGDAVSILPYAGPYPMSAESLDRNMIEATVTNATPLVLRLQDKGNSELHQMLIKHEEGNVYRIDKLANRMGFNRQLTAAVSVASPLEREQGQKGQSVYRRDRNRPSPELIRSITAMDENIDQVLLMGGNFNPQQGGPSNNGGNSLMPTAAGGANLTSTAAICSQAIPWHASDDNLEDERKSAEDAGVTPRGPDAGEQEALREASLLALEKYGALEGLNMSQRLAVQGATSNRLTLVQGPPGTGKTAVAIRILQHWARLAEAQARPGENPSPILATSDSNIAVDNLVEGCANVGLKVVRLGRPEAIRPELLQYCIDRPAEGRGGPGGAGGGGGGYGNMSASAFKEKMKTLKSAQVVCCTCIGSGGDILDNMSFERVMVDEATQATEPAVLVPLTRGCRQLVLVGDHCQLPPTVLSTRAEEEGLGVPLFSRMVACGVPPFMLDTQYRMHPSISMFPSDLFYGGKLNNGVSPPERRPLQGFPWPREEFPVAFIPVVDGVELDDGVSKLNEQEAQAACDAVVALLGGGQCTVSDIAIVTPYAAQVRHIRRRLRELLPPGPPFVEVSSTDGFQGREKEAVIFSAVRSNSYGSVGFVSDWRRINVSFTRARRALIVIGNPDTLRRGDPDTFGAWLQWADAHGINMDRPGIPRGRYEPEVLRKVRGGTTAAEMLRDVLERQQAQLKTAERQQAQAVRNAAGHIMGKEEDDAKKGGANAEVECMLKKDLALMSNDGCWDDSGDEDVAISRNVSRTTLATTSSKGDGEASDAPLDAWDL